MLYEIFNRDYILITHVATVLFYVDAVTLFKLHVQQSLQNMSYCKEMNLDAVQHNWHDTRETCW